MERSARGAAGFLSMVITAGLVGCTPSPPDPAQYLDTEEYTATVTAVDPAARLITLRGPSGSQVSFDVGDSVRNLAQVEVGDQVTLSYYSGVAAEVTDADPQDELGAVDVAGARAAPGERPAGVGGAQVSAVVQVEDVDTGRSTVTFRGGDGLVRMVDVKRPEMQTFIKRLRKGDKVRVSYLEAVAVRVEPLAASP